MASQIAVVDYGMGNLHSVFRKLVQLKANPLVTANPVEILKADKIILPGVGHFEMAMRALKNLNLFDALNETVLVKKTPILGICLGMQLLAKTSEEGNATGFGWIDAEVIRFQIENKLKFKIPQTGWNTANICKESSLFKNIEENSAFYFLHAYHYYLTEPGAILAKTVFEREFVSAVEKENIFGTQFHPEKSHNSGLQLLKNFIQI